MDAKKRKILSAMMREFFRAAFTELGATRGDFIETAREAAVNGVVREAIDRGVPINELAEKARVSNGPRDRYQEMDSEILTHTAKEAVADLLRGSESTSYEFREIETSLTKGKRTKTLMVQLRQKEIALKPIVEQLVAEGRVEKIELGLKKRPHYRFVKGYDWTPIGSPGLALEETALTFGQAARLALRALNELHSPIMLDEWGGFAALLKQDPRHAIHWPRNKNHRAVRAEEFLDAEVDIQELNRRVLDGLATTLRAARGARPDAELTSIVRAVIVIGHGPREPEDHR